MYHRHFNNGNAIPMCSDSFLTTGTAFLFVPLEMSIVVPCLVTFAASCQTFHSAFTLSCPYTVLLVL